MDADSSSKFIGSLTKFLQSLCNGYVDFEDGVELIGHIYLSVDTGKKIDYILNEKVCKSDNSVTFISNSFHAQPADKLKAAVGKKSSEDKSDGGGRKDEDIIMSESGDSLPRTSNVGPTPGRPVGSLRPGINAQNRSLKRPGSPLTSRKASSPPQRRPLTPPTQRRSQLQVSKVSLGSPASSKNVPSSPSSSSQDNIPSPSSRVKTRNDSISAVQTVQLSGDLGDLDKDNQAQGNMLPVVQVPDLSSFLGSATNEGQDVSQEHALATPDDTKPDTDITFIKEEFIPGASSCAQAGSSGQPSGRSMEEQLQDSGSPSGLYPVMLHQNTAAFSSAGNVFPGSFSQLGNATTTSSRAGYNQPVPSTSASQGAADIFSNPVPGTSQDSSGGDPAEAPGPAMKLQPHLGTQWPVLQPATPTTARPLLPPFHLPDLRGQGGRRQYPCPTCGRTFQYPQSRNRHRWKCMGLRLLKCTACAYVSHRVDSLKHHMRTAHSMEAPALGSYVHQE